MNSPGQDAHTALEPDQSAHGLPTKGEDPDFAARSTAAAGDVTAELAWRLQVLSEMIREAHTRPLTPALFNAVSDLLAALHELFGKDEQGLTCEQHR